MTVKKKQCVDCRTELKSPKSKRCPSCNGRRCGKYNGYYDRGTPEQRFWAKVNKNGPTMPHMETPCWEWVGIRNKQGYGNFGVNKRSTKVHRFSYELHYGPFPKELDVLHHCDNPTCCRPDHLFTGTDQDNNDDMKQKGRDCKGEDRPGARLTAEQVIEIRKIYAQGGISYRKLAERFGVKKGTVCHIVTKRSWKHI